MRHGESVCLLLRYLNCCRVRSHISVQSEITEIREHKFFKSIDWAKLLRRELAAPHYPFVNYKEDTSNFDEYPNSKDIHNSPVITPRDADPFADFKNEMHD